MKEPASLERAEPALQVAALDDGEGPRLLKRVEGLLVADRWVTTEGIEQLNGANRLLGAACFDLLEKLLDGISQGTPP